MAYSPRPGPGRRSAFASAFFSALFPGLGHAYLGAWGRALAWATIPILLIALVAGLLVNEETRLPFLLQFSNPAWLLGALLFVVIDLCYRVASSVDAYRLATRDSARAEADSPWRLASMAGVFAIVAVLALSHLALARPLYLAYDGISGIGGGDTSSIEPLPTDLETPPPAPSEMPGGSEGPAEPTPTPTASPTQGPPWNGTERLNILLIGADRRENGGSYLTDTMIVGTIDPVTKHVGMISLPRDTSGVPLPANWAASRHYGGSFPSKINSLYTIARGSPSLFPGNDRNRGYEALKGALSELYQLDIKYYVAVDLGGFVDVINTLGGVVIDVQAPVTDDHYPSDDGRGSLNLYIPPGIRYMTGAEALAYARARHRSSDFDRSQRQQRVLTSVYRQTDLPSILAPGRLEALTNEFKQIVRTDIPPELFPQMIQLLTQIDLSRRDSLVLTPPTFSTVCYPCPPRGLYELRANVQAIRQGVRELIDVDPAAEERRQRFATEAAIVHVLAGSSPLNRARQVASFFAAEGIDASVPPLNNGQAESLDHVQTEIVVYNGREADLTETLELLESTLGVEATFASDPDAAADVVITTGSSTPELTGE